MERGQTTTDYAVGASIFLLVVVGVFAFLPSVFAPFSLDGGASMVVADRTANALAGSALAADATRPTRANATCTEGFFDGDGAVPAGCNYDADAADLHSALGLDDRRSVNVTVTGQAGVASLNGTVLRTGPPVPERGDVVAASRLLLLDGSQHTLTVRVF